MTLDELLALLPDNSHGMISAADLRTIVTELFGDISEVAARVAALEAAGPDGTGGGDISIIGSYRVDSTPGATPASEYMSSETGDWESSTWLRFNKLDTAGVDLTNALLRANAIYVQQSDASVNWGRWMVNGLVTDGGSYIQVPVAWDNGSPGVSALEIAMFVLRVTPTL